MGRLIQAFSLLVVLLLVCLRLIYCDFLSFFHRSYCVHIQRSGSRYRDVLDDLTARIMQQRALAPLEKEIQSDPCRGANPSPRRHPEFNSTWMPFCPTTNAGWDLSQLETPAEILIRSHASLQAGDMIQGVQVRPFSCRDSWKVYAALRSWRVFGLKLPHTLPCFPF